MPAAKLKPQLPSRPAALAHTLGDDVMRDPLHPMHQQLLARLTTILPAEERLTRPKRMAIGFYSAVAAWVLVWLAYGEATALL